MNGGLRLGHRRDSLKDGRHRVRQGCDRSRYGRRLSRSTGEGKDNSIPFHSLTYEQVYRILCQFTILLLCVLFLSYISPFFSFLCSSPFERYSVYNPPNYSILDPFQFASFISGAPPPIPPPLGSRTTVHTNGWQHKQSITSVGRSEKEV